MESVKDIVARARANKLRINAVCLEAGVKPPQVSRWLSGSVQPLWVSVQALQEALDRLIARGAVAATDTAPAPAEPGPTGSS